MEYEVVIGLEVHVQLKIKTKAFCGCSTEFGKPANTQVCPVCLGFPGSLPVLNKKALELAIKVGLALNCQIQKEIRFDRKNYFYPDLPKNYQISQYALPIALGGFLEIDLDENCKKNIGIRRLHLEEDAGKLIHTEKYSLVDFNRSGVALLEIVSEPQISSPHEAYNYLVNLKELLQYLEVSDCDMEKGSLRCDANISLKKKEDLKLGTKIELKNMNSFKAIKDALVYEIERQSSVLKKAKTLIQETRLWDAKQQKTFSMRTKEEAQDYRYFPEPDLVPFVLSEEEIQKIKQEIPELPQNKKQRFIKEYGLSYSEAKFIVSNKDLANYFEDCFSLYPQAKTVYNWIVGSLMAELNERKKEISRIELLPEEFTRLINQVEEKKLTQLKAKEILKKMLDTGESFSKIAQEESVEQISDEVMLNQIVQQVVKENPKSVEDYKAGKNNALMFLVGQVMRKTQKKANPQIVQGLLKEILDK